MTLDEFLAAKAQEQEVDDDSDSISIDHASLSWFLGNAADAGAMPDDVMVWWVADDDGAVGGGIVTVNAPDGKRYASHYQDWKYLVDRDATGVALIRSHLEFVLLVRDQLLAEGKFV